MPCYSLFEDERGQLGRVEARLEQLLEVRIGFGAHPTHPHRLFYIEVGVLWARGPPFGVSSPT